MSRLLLDAIRYAWEGVPVPVTPHENIVGKGHELESIPGFAQVYLHDKQPLKVGSKLRRPRVANTLARLSEVGLSDFYRGDTARSIVVDLESAGSPLGLSDLEEYHAAIVTPLSLRVAGHAVYNMPPPPTQGSGRRIVQV